MRRREFITLLGGGATTWPFAARAQQSGRTRRIGALMNVRADDPEAPQHVGAFERALQQRGWSLGSSLIVDYRWGAGDAKLYRRFAGELVAAAPEVVFAVGGTAVGALQEVTRTIPIVFVNVTDPVNRGLVASLARPGGNTTGLSQFEFSMSGKWLELLKQIAPKLAQVAVIRDPVQFNGIGQLASIQTAAASFGAELIPIDARDPNEIERGIAAFARTPNGGMIVTPSGSSIGNRQVIVAAAAQHRLPTVYVYRYFVTEGGLISYGPDTVDQYRGAADYVDRILKGEKPADLPVLQPTKFELVINLKTAKALGLTVPPSLLTRADEVIE
jgi:putative tryptophan/tyrosine transport system substrate-binding protein